MMQEEIEYFGGPADGRRTSFSALTVAIEVVPDQDWNRKGLSDLKLNVVGGYYSPEWLPEGTWRLHFFDTVQR